MNHTQTTVKNTIHKHAGFAFLTGCAAIVALSFSARAEYAISQQCIAAGGGRSVGGNYQIQATIGQPIAHQSITSGKYQLAAGFWSVAVVQVEGAPVLKMTSSSPGYVTLSWESSDSGWVLQESTSLSSPAWVNSASGSSNPVALSATGAMKFFRLHKP